MLKDAAKSSALLFVMPRLSHEHDALCEAHAACIGLQVELKVDTFQAFGFDEALAKGAKQQDPVPSDLWGQRFSLHLNQTQYSVHTNGMEMSRL